MGTRLMGVVMPCIVIDGAQGTNQQFTRDKSVAAVDDFARHII
jgi:hypothetical protein